MTEWEGRPEGPRGDAVGAKASTIGRAVSTFNFDPELLFRRRRPRVVRSPRFTRFRKIALIVVIAIVVLIALAVASMWLRVNYLYPLQPRPLQRLLDPADRPGGALRDRAVITGGLVWASVPFWARAIPASTPRPAG